MRRLPKLSPLALATASTVLLATGYLSPPTVASPNPLTEASTGGLAALDRALAKLEGHRRLLLVAAHPDDETTSLLALVARGQGGEAAYLSLTRGEGGQNLIGPELGVGLGLLRSRELLAARDVDGARQLFSRAYDFGYTRSLDETLQRWPRHELLADALDVTRRFRPQVLVSVFPSTAAAGHGQHQASGLIAEELFAATRDDAGSPLPWAPVSFYRLGFWDPDQARVEASYGGVEPHSGRSILQLAMVSRSQHRCQDMGVLSPPGDATGRFAWVAGAGGGDAVDLFAGIDTSLPAIAAALPESDLRRMIESRLARVARLAKGTRAELSAVSMGDAVEPLAAILDALRAASGELAVAEVPEPARDHVAALLAEKTAYAEEALATAAAVVADAYLVDRSPGRETVVAGESIAVRGIVWAAGAHPVEDLVVTVAGSGAWRALTQRPAPEPRGRFAARPTAAIDIAVDVPTDAEPSVPYFLRRPRQGDLYDWSGADPGLRGEPFAPPPLALRFSFRVAGRPLTLTREVVYRYRDQAVGEVRRPLRVVPRIEVDVDRQAVPWPLGRRRPLELTATLRSHSAVAQPVRLELDLPPGWPAPPPAELTLDAPFGRATVPLEVVPPADLAPGSYPIGVTAVGEDGSRYSAAFPLVDYEHIRPTPRREEARIALGAGEIHLPERRRVGYIGAPEDAIPELLAEIGLEVTPLSATDLLVSDLPTGAGQDLDSIVIGHRAYETDAALRKAHPRLIDWVRGGGVLVVQYHKYPFVDGGFAPLPLTIDRPHDRIFDETAPATPLVGDHPVLRHPHLIGAADWEGWVQERGLYFAGTWDDGYLPLLSFTDDRGEAQHGALLVAELGKGRYVYTGLAFFRQLPAGVLGAYRIFVNLLGLADEVSP